MLHPTSRPTVHIHKRTCHNALVTWRQHRKLLITATTTPAICHHYVIVSPPPPSVTIASPRHKSPRHNRLHVSGVVESRRRTEEFNVMMLMSEKRQQPSQLTVVITWWPDQMMSCRGFILLFLHLSMIGCLHYNTLHGASLSRYLLSFMFSFLSSHLPRVAIAKWLSSQCFHYLQDHIIFA